jgi:hypothetical protein
VVSSAALVVLGAPGCGAGYPPILDNEIPDAGSDGGLHLGSDTGPPPSCNTGPKDGVCGCFDLPLTTHPPNLYFLLDRSGSMNDDDKWDIIRDAISHVTEEIGPRANFGAAVFPSPEASANSCAPGVQVAGMRRGDSPAGSYGPTTEYLQEATDMPAAGGTPTAATVLALTDKLASFHEKTYVILATDGGPDCDGAISCTSADCILNIESSVAGCTPGGGVDCCSSALYGPLNCLDGTATVAAIAALAARGVPTYVMGIPGSGPYAGILDQMAQAGRTARSTKPYYYPVETTGEGSFYGALSQIAAKTTATCELAIGAAPKDPGLLNVYLGGKVVPEAGPNGWTTTVTDGQETVTLLGNSCTEVLEGDVLDVRVIEGCPTVEH